LSTPKFSYALEHSQVSRIAEAAVLAPSADNSHTFFLQPGGSTIRLVGSKAFLSAPPHRRILSLLSFGTAVKNMEIRAASLGLSAKVAYFPAAHEPDLVAQLDFSPSGTVPSGLDLSRLDAPIISRHTNRRLRFSGPRLNGKELSALLRDAPAAGVTLRFLDTAPERSILLRLLRIAESERFRTRTMHAELFGCMRFDAGWHASVEEGLPLGALGVEPGLRGAFAQLRHWPVMKALSAFGVHRLLGLRSADLPCRLAPHCGVLTTRLSLDPGALAVGWSLEHLWLEAESRGLAFQPLAASALLALPQYGDVPPALGAQLRREWGKLTDEIPLMVFRLGYASAPRIRAGRPPAGRFVHP
jgi:hypothetical protein